MLYQQARNSIILPLGGALNIFEQIQTPPNVLLLLKHTCMLSVSTLSSNKTRSVHLWDLTPALSLLCKIGLCISSLIVPSCFRAKVAFPSLPKCLCRLPFPTAPLWALLHLFIFSLVKGHLFHFISVSHLVYGLAPAVLTDTLSAPHAGFWKPFYIRSALVNILELEPLASCCANLFSFVIHHIFSCHKKKDNYLVYPRHMYNS